MLMRWEMEVMNSLLLLADLICAELSVSPHTSPSVRGPEDEDLRSDRSRSEADGTRPLLRLLIVVFVMFFRGGDGRSWGRSFDESIDAVDCVRWRRLLRPTRAIWRTSARAVYEIELATSVRVT